MTKQHTAALDLAAEINKAFGAGTIVMGSDPSMTVRFLPTGVLPIDVLMDGGLPRGRFIEIYGDFSTLKTWVALKAMATTQAAGGTIAIVDTEHAWDPDWFAALGGDPTGVIVMQPSTGEEAIDVMEALVRNHVDLVVWDSIAATLPMTEAAKGSTEPVQPARLAALMSKGLRKLTAANHDTAVLCLNQTRINVGIVFGSPETTPGGKALPFYSSVRLSLRKGPKLSEEATTWDGTKNVKVKRITGQTIRATLEKSKVSAPFQDTFFVFSYLDHEVDEAAFLLSWGSEHGHVGQEGQSWVYDGVKVRGREAFLDKLRQTPDLAAKLKSEILLACRGNIPVAKSKAASPSAKSSKPVEP